MLDQLLVRVGYVLSGSVVAGLLTSHALGSYQYAHKREGVNKPNTFMQTQSLSFTTTNMSKAMFQLLGSL